MKQSGLETVEHTASWISRVLTVRATACLLCALAAGCTLPKAQTRPDAGERSGASRDWTKATQPTQSQRRPDAGQAAEMSAGDAGPETRAAAGTTGTRSNAANGGASSMRAAEADGGTSRSPAKSNTSGAAAPAADGGARSAPSDAGAMDNPSPAAGSGASTMTMTTMTTTTPPPTRPRRPDEDSRDGETGPIVQKPDETCYTLKAHGGQTVDATPFEVSAGTATDTYEQFYFSVPWPTGTVATIYGTKVDNTQVLHHWFLFSTSEKQAEGAHSKSALPTLTGTEPQLLAAWTLGAPNLAAPTNVGLELPAPGRTLNLQMHYANLTGSVQQDASSVQICTVPANKREHLAAFTALGTEDLNGNVWQSGAGMPPHKEASFSTTCTPARRGLDADASIKLLGFMPHMHRLGTHMNSRLRRTNGQIDPLFDDAFSFGKAKHTPVSYDLKGGEALLTTCTFFNSNDYGVAFGETANDEMCYLFALAYPARALANGANSLLGWTDTCW